MTSPWNTCVGLPTAWPFKRVSLVESKSSTNQSPPFLSNTRACSFEMNRSEGMDTSAASERPMTVCRAQRRSKGGWAPGFTCSNKLIVTP